MANWRLNSYAAAMFATAVVSAGLAAYIGRRREAQGAAPLAVLMASIAWWSFGYALELGSPGLAVKTFWADFNFLGIVTVPGAWLVFTLQYTRRDRWLNQHPWSLAVLAAPALLTLALAWTNSAHLLIRSDVRLDTTGPIPMFDPTYGAGFWAFWLYAASLLLAGTLLVIHALVTSPGLYRGQAAALLAGALVPWIGNSLYLSGLSPFHKLDLTPFSFTAAGLCLAWGLFHYRLLDIVPVARDAVIESMSDGLIVLDAQARLVDINPAAQVIIGRTAAQTIGQPVHLALPGEAGRPERYTATTETHAEIVLQVDQKPRDFRLSIAPLYEQPSRLFPGPGREDRGRLTGRLAILHDITERKRLHEYEIKQIERDLDIARQIQVNLLPSAAPEIAGLDIVGLSQPARQVGGDFYNYFVFDHEQVGIAVGDVSGKGIQAALMMALSYGLLTTQVRRALAPAALLAALNVELRPHTQRSKLNTALAYLALKPAGAGWELQVGNAGLVAPLVRRRGGKVEWWDIGGLPLGTMREEGKEYEQLAQALYPGDALILSSDGIVEAMNKYRELYGFERLTSCVAAAAGDSAAAIQEHVLSDVQAFVDGAEQNDDMTLVVVRIE